MVIQMCQAASLADLMVQMQRDFGPDAVLLAVRRIDLPPTASGPAFLVEGTIGVKRAAEPLPVSPAKAPLTAALPKPAPQTASALTASLPPAKPYEAPRAVMVPPLFAKPQPQPQASLLAQAAAKPIVNPALTRPPAVKPAATAATRAVETKERTEEEVPSFFNKNKGAQAELPTAAVRIVESEPVSRIAPVIQAVQAVPAILSPRKLQEAAKSNFLRKRVNAERASARNGGKFGTHAIALVGPMGAGKTTTTAKIAGRFRSQRKEPVGVVSTDTDRPGGSTLLMAYAQELQLHGTTATTAPELRDRMVRWSRRGPLVIDTRGCSPRDSLAIERMGEMFNASGFEVERYLVLSATEHPLIARECLQNFDELELNGVILTRVDQAAGIGHCLEEVRASGLPIVFAGTGEAVPQDLVEPTTTTFRALEITAQAVLV